MTQEEENKLAFEHLISEIHKAAENSIKSKPHGIVEPVIYKTGFKEGAVWMFENIFKFIRITD